MGVGYAGQDETVELRLSSDGNELAIVDLIGRRRRCDARLPADGRADVAAALARMAEAAERSTFSDAPAKVLAEDGGRIDVAALPSGVAIYIFPPGSWKSRSVRLVPRDARQLAAEMRHRGGTARRPARP
ncbi:MAG TPA: hypothetical protein DCK98_14325 [Chloroflexi bacterium]|nr:hypothetical protein [Chloroflexota bacterium]